MQMGFTSDTFSASPVSISVQQGQDEFPTVFLWSVSSPETNTGLPLQKYSVSGVQRLKPIRYFLAFGKFFFSSLHWNTETSPRRRHVELSQSWPKL